MTRAPLKRVLVTGQHSFVKDKGSYDTAYPSPQSGMYLLSDTPLGSRPLMLFGTYSEILYFLTENRASGIDNKMRDLADVHVSVFFDNKPKAAPESSRYKLYDPVPGMVKKVAGFVLGTGLSAGVDLAKGLEGVLAQGLASSPDFADGAEKLKDMSKAALQSRAKARMAPGPTKAEDPGESQRVLCVQFGYLDGPGTWKVGSGRVTFGACYDEILRAMQQLFGIKAPPSRAPAATQQKEVQIRFHGRDGKVTKFGGTTYSVP